MPYSERTYLRGSSNYFPQGVKWLLIANIGLFLLQFFAGMFGASGIFRPFYLSPIEVVTQLAVWQLVTYLFLHDPGGFSHILFNMLALWMFGMDIERAWGTRRFLKFYFLCGVGAGLCVVVLNLLFGNPYARTIGASGAIYGLLLAFAMLWPDRQILFNFLIPIKAKYYAMIIGAITFLSALAAPGGPVSHIAHLGGMIFAWFYVRSVRSASPYARATRPRTSLIASARAWYKEWKVQRARRKFEVYMKKRERDHDRYVH